MNKIKLKVCGMRDYENIMQLAALHPDYMGFIFYDKSPRYVGEDFTLPNDFPKTIKKVGVFVNASSADIIRKAAKLDLQAVQLHGTESVTQCKELRNLGFDVIKVFSIGDDFDFKVTEAFEEVVDYFLFDTKGKFFGGNAATFDWSVLHTYNQHVPYFLSGGLTMENVAQIQSLENTNLYAVDVNSGVEISPALKSIDKVKEIKEFLKN